MEKNKGSFSHNHSAEYIQLLILYYSFKLFDKTVVILDEPLSFFYGDQTQIVLILADVLGFRKAPVRFHLVIVIGFFRRTQFESGSYLKNGQIVISSDFSVISEIIFI